jgi:tetratricopeptide (TPR) repeat protein
MRGSGGDLERAIELGDLSLERWVEGSRPLDLRHHLHLHADAKYWVGQYEESVALSRRLRGLARDVQSAESLLRGGGFEAVALVELGRHEEAFELWDGLFEVARELGQNPRGLLNYSTLAYRELYDLDEARRRSEQALELSAGETFGMPKQYAGSDLLFTDLLAGDVGSAQAAWPRLWEGAREATGWTTWLIAGRLLCGRAEVALLAETAEECLEWSGKALDVARRTRRRKYEGRSLTVLGRALARLGRKEEALAALRSAVAVADELVGPPARWHAQAALGEAAYTLGEDDTAAEAYRRAAALIEAFAGTLAPERASRFLAASPVGDVLSASR